jgi:hypothetical protein
MWPSIASTKEALKEELLSLAFLQLQHLKIAHVNGS